MDCRVWGVLQDRLIEIRAERVAGDGGLLIEGLPEERTRTTADRVRAALLNSALVREAGGVKIHLEPAVRSGPANDLDLALALAALAQVGAIPGGLRWILATGRLGLDGRVHAEGVPERLSLADVVQSLCRTPFV